MLPVFYHDPCNKDVHCTISILTAPTLVGPAPGGTVPPPPGLPVGGLSAPDPVALGWRGGSFGPGARLTCSGTYRYNSRMWMSLYIFAFPGGGGR